MSQSRYVIDRQKSIDYVSIKLAQTRNDRVKNQAAQRQSAEEFLPRVLQSACGDQERNKRKWRRQQSRNRDGPEAPSFKRCVNLRRSRFRELALHRLLATFSGQSISNV